jgi:TonB family protein
MLGSSVNSAAAVGWRWRRPGRMGLLCAFACTCLLVPLRLRVASGSENTPPHASINRSGDLPAANGMTLHLNADLGNVRIQTFPPGSSPAVHYEVRIETDAPGLMAQQLLGNYTLNTRETSDGIYLSGSLPNVVVNRHSRIRRDPQFWVQFTVTVPASFSLDISTGVGDIETGDVGGRASLITHGGAIATGRIGMMSHGVLANDRPMAKIETDGGPITLRDVAGDVDAFTAGGNIMAANINGNAALRTGGGDIRAAQIKGTAQLETEGGNITVGEAGSLVTVRTGGGQIDFGQARGPVHAQTGGGGIRVMYVVGPMEVATSGGSICLTHVADTVQAQTTEGSITAWITPEAAQGHAGVRLPGASQLASRNGNIIVFVPRNISMTIDATVDSGGPTRIEADPSLPLSVLSQANGMVHAVASLNGGGAPLKLHTVGGKIQLQYLDAQPLLRQSLVKEQKERLAERLNVSLPTPPPPGMNFPAPMEVKADWLDRFEVFFMGSLRENERDFRQHLIANPLPEYPALARNAGVQGVVVAQVRMKTDGSISVDKIVEGEPSLADAVVAAVKNWRGTPEQVNGKNVEVVSTVSFNFTLR